MDNLRTYLDKVAAYDKKVLGIMDTEIKYQISAAYINTELERPKLLKGSFQIGIEHLEAAFKMTLIKMGEKTTPLMRETREEYFKIPWKKIKLLRDSFAHMPRSQLQNINSMDIIKKYYFNDFQFDQLEKFSNAYKDDDSNPLRKDLARHTASFLRVQSIMERKVPHVMNKDGWHYAMFLPDEEKDLRFIMDHSTSFYVANASEMMSSLSVLFTESYGAKSNFPSLKVFKSVRNFIDHDNLGNYINNKPQEYAQFAEELRLLLLLPEIIKKQYNQNYDPKKNARSVSAEGYFAHYFGGMSPKKLEVMNGIIEHFDQVAEGARKPDDEQVYLMKIADEAKKISDPKKLKELVDKTIENVYSPVSSIQVISVTAAKSNYKNSEQKEDYIGEAVKRTKNMLYLKQQGKLQVGGRYR